MQFNLTDEQIKIIQLYFIAEAFKSWIQEIFEKWEQQILSSGTYHYDDMCYTSSLQNRGFKFPNDRILRHRIDLGWISGTQLHGTPEYKNTDHYRFNNELRKKALAAGCKHGENALVMAQNDVHQLTYQLVDVIFDIHKANGEDIVYLEPGKSKKIKFDLYPFVTTMDSYEPLRIQFYKERIQAVENKIGMNRKTGDLLQRLKKRIAKKRPVTSNVYETSPALLWVPMGSCSFDTPPSDYFFPLLPNGKIITILPGSASPASIPPQSLPSFENPCGDSQAFDSQV